MPLAPVTGRSLTLVAVLILTLDGLALGGLGLWAGRPPLVLGGLTLLALALLVLHSWHRRRRRLAELESARRELQAEAEALQQILRSRR